MARFYCLACGELPLSVGEPCKCGQDALDSQVPAEAELIENRRAFRRAYQLRRVRTVAFILACFGCFMSYALTRHHGPNGPAFACVAFGVTAFLIVPR